MDERKPIDDLFRNGLAERDLPFDEAHWEETAAYLDAQDGKRRRRIAAWLFLLLGVAITVGLVWSALSIPTPTDNLTATDAIATPASPLGSDATVTDPPSASTATAADRILQRADKSSTTPYSNGNTDRIAPETAADIELLASPSSATRSIPTRTGNDEEPSRATTPDILTNTNRNLAPAITPHDRAQPTTPPAGQSVLGQPPAPALAELQPTRLATLQLPEALLTPPEVSTAPPATDEATTRKLSVAVGGQAEVYHAIAKDFPWHLGFAPELTVRYRLSHRWSLASGVGYLRRNARLLSQEALLEVSNDFAIYNEANSFAPRDYRLHYLYVPLMVTYAPHRRHHIGLGITSHFLVGRGYEGRDELFLSTGSMDFDAATLRTWQPTATLSYQYSLTDRLSLTADVNYSWSSIYDYEVSALQSTAQGALPNLPDLNTADFDRARLTHLQLGASWRLY